MIRHFCDICGCEQVEPERIKVNIKAREIMGEKWFTTVGDNLINLNFECCTDCYNELVDIIDSIHSYNDIAGNDTELTKPETFKTRTNVFNRLRNWIRKR